MLVLFQIIFHASDRALIKICIFVFFASWISILFLTFSVTGFSYFQCDAKYNGQQKSVPLSETIWAETKPLSSYYSIFRISRHVVIEFWSPDDYFEVMIDGKTLQLFILFWFVFNGSALRRLPLHPTAVEDFCCIF